MRIAFLCKRYYTNKDLISDQFGRNFELPKALRKSGHEVVVFALDYKGKSAENLTIAGVQFLSIPLFSFSGLIVLRFAFKKIRAFSPTHIISSGDSHIGYAGLILSRLMKAKSIFDIYDYYPSFGSNKLPFMKKMFYSTLKKVNLTLCASRNLATFALSFNSNVLLLENGIDTNKFKKLDKANCRKQLGISPEEIVIGYFGSMEPMRGVDNLISACDMLKQNYPQLKLLIAGKTSSNINLNSSWIDYRGQVNQNQIVKMINASDVVTLPYLPAPLIDFGNSCKTGEYLACQVPLVATSVDNLKVNYPEVIKEIPEAICEPGNIDALSKAIAFQLKEKKLVLCPDRINWVNLGNKLEKRLFSLT
jgi:glycosyltransferase involved in cell wall biosynthesis